MRRGAGVVALTGASGFVGAALLKALLADGYAVRALQHHTPLSAHPNLTIIHGSLGDAEACTHLVTGADTVIHAGALVLARRDADFFRINTAATEQLAITAQAAGVKKFLFVSSLAARAPHLSPYAASKHVAEQSLTRLPHLAWDIIRPPAIYGAGDANSRPFLAMLARGHLWLPVQQNAVVSMLHVQDLVQAILCWHDRDAVPTRCTYELADQTGGYRWHELITIARTALAAPLRLHPIPRTVALASAHIAQACARAQGRASFISPGKIRELAHPDWSVDNTAFITATGWHPSIKLAEGLAETMGWCKKEAYLRQIT